jgi:uncharacterized protein YdaU (DUF1376 family)
VAAELTRFDFHVNKFLHSDDVESMTAEEVGQYILLLCHSFVKDEASLPDDPAVLARYARVKKVSDLVMKKFPLVDMEGTPRRRNGPLYKEYLRAKSRSESGRSSVAERWEKESITNVIPTYNERINESKSDLYTHTNPSQTIPNQSTHTTPVGSSPGTWKTLAIRFRGVIGKFISSTKTNKQKYSEFCNQYGEDRILSAFDDWAGQNKSWLAEKGDALFFFWKELPDLIEAVSFEQEKQEPEIPEEKVAAAISSSVCERVNQIDEELERIKKQKEFDEAHKDEI